MAAAVAVEELVPPYLNLFQKTPSLLAVNEFQYDQINTKSALENNLSLPQLSFDIPADKINFTSLQDSYLYLNVQYFKGDGGAHKADDPLPVGPVNNLLQSMIKSCTMYINDFKVTPIEQNLSYIHYITSFLKNKAIKESGAYTAKLWYDDTLISPETVNQANPEEADVKKANAGLTKRWKFFGGDKRVELCGRIMIPPHLTDRLYLPNLKFSYTFELNPFDFYTMSEDAASGAFTLRILEARMFIRRVAVSSAMSVAITQQLQTNNAVYPLRYVISRTQNIPPGSTAYYWQNVFTGNDLPFLILVAFVSNEAYRGNLKENPFYFKNLGLTETTVYLGGQRIPNVQIKNAFKAKKSLALFWKTLSSLNDFDSDHPIGGWDRETYANSYIQAFDLSRDGKTKGAYINNSFSAGSISLNLEFGATERTEIPQTCIVLGICDGYLEINSLLQAITSYV